MDAPTLNREQLLAKWQHVLDRTFDIFTWTSPGELCWLAECASRATTIFEIGCYHGRSTMVMALASPDSTIVACDLPQDDRCQKILLINTEENASCAEVFMNLGVSSLVDWGVHGFAQFAFIDGGHLFDDVSGDIANLLPHMAPGAIISGHDWRHEDPNDGVNRGVLAHFRMEQLRFHESIWWVKLP